MGKSEVKFGDKVFLYGQFLSYADNFGEYEYNALMGHMTVGGYLVRVVETDVVGASVPGLLIDFPVDGQFTVATPFNQLEMVDITGKLALSPPLPAGTKVWMPL